MCTLDWSARSAMGENVMVKTPVFASKVTLE
jgi:hypothetical protein